MLRYFLPPKFFRISFNGSQGLCMAVPGVLQVFSRQCGFRGWTGLSCLQGTCFRPSTVTLAQRDHLECFMKLHIYLQFNLIYSRHFHLFIVFIVILGSSITWLLLYELLCFWPKKLVIIFIITKVHKTLHPSTHSTFSTSLPFFFPITQYSQFCSQ